MISVKIYYWSLNSFLPTEMCSCVLSVVTKVLEKHLWKICLKKKTLVNFMYDELLVFFFKCNTSFFLIHKVSIYNRKVCASFSQTWFFTFITLRFPFDMLYFSHSFLLSLNIYVLHQLFFKEMIFKKMIFLNIRNLSFRTAKWWLCYLGVLFHWENIAPLYFFMGVFISWRESLFTKK